MLLAELCVHLLGAAMFWEIWALFLHINLQSEFPVALMEAYRNNHILFNVVIYKEGSRRSEKHNRLSQPELTSLPVFISLCVFPLSSP